MDINIKNKNGETPLITLLRGVKHPSPLPLNAKTFREVLEILIFNNPDAELNKSAVQAGIKVDEFFWTRFRWQVLEISGAYILDGKEHCIHSIGGNHAMNFIAPLLIECGFIYCKSNLSKTTSSRVVISGTSSKKS